MRSYASVEVDLCSRPRYAGLTDPNHTVIWVWLWTRRASAPCGLFRAPPSGGLDAGVSEATTRVALGDLHKAGLIVRDKERDHVFVPGMFGCEYPTMPEGDNRWKSIAKQLDVIRPISATLLEAWELEAKPPWKQKSEAGPLGIASSK